MGRKRKKPAASAAGGKKSAAGGKKPAAGGKKPAASAAGGGSKGDS